MQFRVFGSVPISGLAFGEPGSSALQSIKFHRAQLSKTYHYKGPRTLEFIKGGNTESAIAAFEFNETNNRWLLFFIPSLDQNNQGISRYQILGLADDFEKIPLGSYVFLNLSEHDYQAEYSGKVLSLPRGLSRSYTASGDSFLGLTYISSGHKIEVGGVNFGLTPDARAIILISPPSRKTSLQPLLRVIIDESKPDPKKR